VIGVEQGIILAIVLSVILHVKRHYSARDAVVEIDQGGRARQVPATPGTQTEPGLVLYRFGVGVFYANASRLMADAMALVSGPQQPRWFILVADAIDDVDYTGGKTLAELAEQLSQRGIVFGVANTNEHVRGELERFGVTAYVEQGHMFDTIEDAVAAIHRAPQGSGA
jgi:MFS superfamily sulfate permease-like transporter